MRTKKPRFFYGYVVLLAAFFAAMVVWGTRYTFGVFFKPLLAEFGWTRATTAGAFSLGTLLRGIGMFGMGRLTDKLGPRVVITACGLFMGVGYLLTSQISTIWQLYVFYGLFIAIGMSAAYIPIVSTIAKWFVKRRGTMTGIALSGVGIGTLIMPPVAHWLISTHGWRNAYIIVGIIALVLIISAAQLFRRDPQSMGQLPYGANQTLGSEVKEQSPDSEARGFYLQEAIQTKPLWMLMAISFCCIFGVELIFVHVAPHAIKVGISAATAANILAVIGISGTVGRITIGATSDRIGNRLAMTLSCTLVTMVLLWLQAAKEAWMFYLFAAVFGFAYGGVITLLPGITAELFGLTSHGSILGIVMLSGVTFGGALGPVLAGGIFDVTGSYYLAFLISAGLGIIAIALTLLLRVPQRVKGP